MTVCRVGTVDTVLSRGESDKAERGMSNMMERRRVHSVVPIKYATYHTRFDFSSSYQFDFSDSLQHDY